MSETRRADSSPDVVEQQRERGRRYYAEHRDAARARMRAYAAANKEKARVRAAQWRAANPEKVKASEDRQKARHPEAAVKRSQRYRLAHPEQMARKRQEEWLLRPGRVLARKKVNEAVRKGLITKPEACEACGSGGRLDAHHPDYEQPLNVRWLCRFCHKATHLAAPIDPLMGTIKPSLHGNNKSGYRGVSWDKESRKWAAQITVGGRHIRIGRYTTAEEASVAYEAERKRRGVMSLHERHAANCTATREDHHG